MVTPHQRLYAVVLRLAVLQRGAVPRDHGDQVRDAFLNTIRMGDETLAQQLHDANIHLPHIRIGAVHFMVTDVFASGSHPESGSVSASELVER